MCAATNTVTTKQTSHQKPARTGTATAGHIRIHKTATRWEGGEIAFHLGSRQQQQRAQTHSAPPPNQPKPPRAASSLPLPVPTPARVQTPESPHLTRCDARPPPARAPSSHALQQGSSSPLPPSVTDGRAGDGPAAAALRRRGVARARAGPAAPRHQPGHRGPDRRDPGGHGGGRRRRGGRRAGGAQEEPRPRLGARAGGRPGQVPPRHRRQGTCVVYARCCPLLRAGILGSRFSARDPWIFFLHVVIIRNGFECAHNRCWRSRELMDVLSLAVAIFMLWQLWFGGETGSDYLSPA